MPTSFLRSARSNPPHHPRGSTAAPRRDEPTTEDAIPTRTPITPDVSHAHHARHAAAVACEIAGFALHSLASSVERRGKKIEATSASPADDWAATAADAMTYDRVGAVAWAVQNVDGPATIHSNCAYFVSDALRIGGGLPTTSRWLPGTTPSRVRRWQRIAEHPAYGCVGDFVIEMQRVGYARLIGTDTMLAAPPDAELGDVVVYNWDGRGLYQHVAVVTAFEDGVMRVTQQTPSQRNRPWNRYGDGRWIETASLLRFATSAAADPFAG